MAEKSRRPQDTPFKQQRLYAWQPVLSPNVSIGFFFLIGIVFIPLGAVMHYKSTEVIEYKFQYDGPGTDSQFDSCRVYEKNSGSTCTITFNIEEKMQAPIYVYYQLSDFYQNHRQYVKSRNTDQLRGTVYTSKSALSDCSPLETNGSLILSPCGLIANSLFNDVIRLKTSNYTLMEDNIAWDSDIEKKYQQPNGFEYKKVPDNLTDCTEYVSSPCSIYCDTGFPYGYETEVGSCYAYHYPYDDQIQYLYESYAMVVNPIDGVKNEHFVNWMRLSGLPEFRKLYGRIDLTLNPGDVLTFEITNNFEVNSFNGKKALVISTVSWFGGKNSFLGYSYMIAGAICIFLGIIFLMKSLACAKRKIYQVIVGN